MKILLYFFLCLLTFNVTAQPSFTVQLSFSMYDEVGNVIEFDEFCEDYKLWNEHFQDITSCNEKSAQNSFYDPQLKLYTVSGGIVYNDLILYFINEGDTMKLVLDTGGGGNHRFKIHHLTFKPGKFRIRKKDMLIVNFNIPEVNYYNHILTGVLQIRSQYAAYKTTPQFAELMELKTKYGIHPEDYEEKGMDLIKQ